MKSITETVLLDMLAKNYIDRNKQLSTLIRFINSFDKSVTLAIDGSWGSGKTVLVKQLELLNQRDDIGSIGFPSIDTIALHAFRDKYDVYYFNAWENDFLDDPLQALTYNLVNDLTTEGLQERSMKKAARAIDISSLVKNLSKDSIDINRLTSEEEMIKEVKSIIDRKHHVHDLIDRYTAKSEKKLLFIIDELDRCKPSFAVNLLEVIKHYFVDKDIAFVVTTNNQQLAHTVCKYYGNNFDGFAYLNKFFDYNMSLQSPDTKKFIELYLGKKNDSTWARLIPAAIVQHLHMSMREIESYYKALELIDGYMKRERMFDDNATSRFCQWIFVPYALALKIKQIDTYEKFTSGDGDEALRKLCLRSNNIHHLAERYVTDKTNFNANKAAEFIVLIYEGMFTPGDNYDIKETLDSFKEIITLISPYVSIKESDGEGSND